MAHIRIRKDNPSKRTEDVLDVFGESVKMNTTDFVEISDSDVKALCLNPTLYEGIPEVKKSVVEEKPKKKK